MTLSDRHKFFNVVPMYLLVHTGPLVTDNQVEMLAFAVIELDHFKCVDVVGRVICPGSQLFQLILIIVDKDNIPQACSFEVLHVVSSIEGSAEQAKCTLTRIEQVLRKF